MVYLFVGGDSLSKDTQLARLKKEYLPKDLEQFNLDILHAPELTLKTLQEKLLSLPVKSSKRLVIVKSSQDLNDEAKDFLAKFVKKPFPYLILVLDVDRKEKRNEFINRIYKYAKVIRFKEEFRPDTFTLSRTIALKKPDNALRILNQLLKDGERPERILGGLRYAWERESTSSLEARKRLRLLINCDMEIKMGRLKPIFALEKLVVNLCALGKPFH